MGIKKNYEKMAEADTLTKLKQTINNINEFVVLMSNPENIDQARDNLKDIRRYVETVLVAGDVVKYSQRKF